MLGSSELLIIFGGLVLLFGANQLPKLGGAVGECIRNFKKGVRVDSGDNTQKPSKTESHSSSVDS